MKVNDVDNLDENLQLNLLYKHAHVCQNWHFYPKLALLAKIDTSSQNWHF